MPSLLCCQILIGLDGRPFMRFPPGTEPEVVRPIMERMSSATQAALAAGETESEMLSVSWLRCWHTLMWVENCLCTCLLRVPAL